MKYAIDRIEENIVILEDISTNEIIEVDKILLPKNIFEGNIINYEDNSFYLDIETENLRRKRIAEKLNRLKGLNKDE